MSGVITYQNADELERKFWNDVPSLLSIRGTPDLDSENEFRSFPTSKNLSRNIFATDTGGRIRVCNSILYHQVWCQIRRSRLGKDRMKLRRMRIDPSRVRSESKLDEAEKNRAK